MKKNNYYYFLIDILLTIVIYVLIHFSKFGYLLPQGIYSILLILYLTYWYTLSTYYNKYSPGSSANKVPSKGSLTVCRINSWKVTGIILNYFRPLITRYLRFLLLNHRPVYSLHSQHHRNYWADCN